MGALRYAINEWVKRVRGSASLATIVLFNVVMWVLNIALGNYWIAGLCALIYPVSFIAYIAIQQRAKK